MGTLEDYNHPQMALNNFMEDQFISGHESLWLNVTSKFRGIFRLVPSAKSLLVSLACKKQDAGLYGRRSPAGLFLCSKFVLISLFQTKLPCRVVIRVKGGGVPLSPLDDKS